MNRTLYIGFKGNNNASAVLVRSITENGFLLTNSFGGLKRDIDMMENTRYDSVLLFGIDPSLKEFVRIERSAQNKEGEILLSTLDLETISSCLNFAGVKNRISDKPTNYLCNAAYWHLLKKFDQKVVLIHIPSIKNCDKGMRDRITAAVG